MLVDQLRLRANMALAEECGEDVQTVLTSCVRTGALISDPDERGELQNLARELGDSIFQSTGEYPEAVIFPLDYDSATFERERLVVREFQNKWEDIKTSTDPSKGPKERVLRNFLDELKEAGSSIENLANRHMLTWLVRDVADAFFRAFSEYPSTGIKPFSLSEKAPLIE